MNDLPWRSLRWLSRLAIRRRVDLAIEGGEHLPKHGPVILAARHYHHLWDGAILVGVIPRPVHILVALDWTGSGPSRFVLARLCAAARWPSVMRSARPGAPAKGNPKDAARYLRRAVDEAVGLLREGRILLIFPEAYPNVDPTFTPKRGDDFLPFEPGFVRLAEIAGRSGISTPIVPVGFTYNQATRWRVTLRYGEPVTVGDNMTRDEAARIIEARVRALS